MKKKTIICVALSIILCFALFTGCKPKETQLKEVRMAIHSNEGAALFAIAEEQGIFAKYGIKPVLTIVDSGPPEIAAMRADNRTLDIGYIGSGVAWNAIDNGANQLSFVFFDFLGNSEQLLAKKGVFVDSNKNGTYDPAEIRETLKGKKIYFEVGTTPGVYFFNLLETLNEGVSPENQLWVDCDTASYLAGYTAPNNNEANKVLVVNYANANIAAGMATTDANSVEIAIAFSPVTTTILTTNNKVEKVCDTTILPESKANVGTWVASNAWMAEDPETVQNVINALYEGAIYRTEHIEDSMRAGERVCQKPANSFNSGIVRSLTKAEYAEWFADTNSRGYTYMRSLYDSRKGAIPEGSTAKSFEQSFVDTYLLNAIKNIK